MIRIHFIFKDFVVNQHQYPHSTVKRMIEYVPSTMYCWCQYKKDVHVYMCKDVHLCSVLHTSISPYINTFYSILFNPFYSRLCPSTAGSSPPPESSIFLCPLLSLSIPLPVAPQCHLSNDVLVFQLILLPLSATLCFSQSIYCLSFGQCVQPLSVLYFLHIGLCLSLWFVA